MSIDALYPHSKFESASVWDSVKFYWISDILTD